MSAALTISELSARVGEVPILRGVDLTVPHGELHVIMGPNGSGKSTLCHVLSGKPDYDAAGSARVGDTELLGLEPDERARAGMAQAFQYPEEIPGVTLRDLLEELAPMLDGDGFWERVDRAVADLGVARFLDRPVNVGLSGGEKKRSEIFQLVVLAPEAMVLDEIDSGLDIDAVREVAATIERLRSPDVGVLLITHYNRILRYLRPDRIHIMLDGRIVTSGGPELGEELETKGYATLRSELGLAPASKPEA